MRIIVGIATLGRPEALLNTVDRLADQTRQPDAVYVAAVTAADVSGIEASRLIPHILLTPRGSCVQRNAILDEVEGRADVVVFFDDDFVPANDYLAQLEAIFASDPAIVGLTGDLLADGMHGEPIEFSHAVKMLEARDEVSGALRTREALYGCNMAIRLAAAGNLRFDENLPEYGWLEDIDYTFQLARRGRLASGPQLTGVHLGNRRARQPGKRLGYSQVANVAYLSAKGTMQPGLGRRLLFQNLMSNVIKSLWPGSDVDRRGRLHGNILAISDVVRGKAHPRRIKEL